MCGSICEFGTSSRRKERVRKNGNWSGVLADPPQVVASRATDLSLGDHSTMLKSRSRCWMLLALVTILSLSVTWTVRAATEQAVTIPATSTPVTTPAVTPAYYSPSGIAGRTTPFHDGVAAKYNYAFGKDAPFLPSNATSSNGQFLDPKSFPTAEYCGHCHKEAYRQWRQSVHANAFREPWYLKNVDMLIDRKAYSSPVIARDVTIQWHYFRAAFRRACPRNAPLRTRASPAPPATRFNP